MRYDELKQRVQKGNFSAGGNSYASLKARVGNLDEIKKRLAERNRRYEEQQAKMRAKMEQERIPRETEKENNKWYRKAGRATKKFIKEPGKIKKTADFLFGGATETWRDLVTQKSKDKLTKQRLDVNYRAISAYREALKQTDDEEKEKIMKERMTNLIKQNFEEINKFGGKLKNKTTAQLFGQALEAGIDLGTIGGWSAIKGVFGKPIAKAGIKVGGKLAKEVGTKTIGAMTGAGVGAGIGLQERDATAKDVMKSAGVGAVGGAVLTAGGEFLIKKGSKLFRKIFAKTDKIESKVQPKGIDINRPPKGRKVDDFIVNKNDITVKKAPDGLLNSKEEPIKTHLNWNYKKKKGTLFLTPSTEKKDIAREVGNYLVKKNPKYVEDFSEDALKVIKKDNKDLSENFSEAVAEIVTDPKAREKVPEFAEMLKKEGIAVEKTRVYTGEEKIAKKEKEFTNKKTSRIANSIEQKMKDEGLLGVDDTIKKAHYEQKTVTKEAEKVAKIISDEKKLNKVLSGEDQLPENVSGMMFVKGVEDKILKTKDVAKAKKMAEQLMNDNFVGKSSKHAQEMRFMRERDPDSVTVKIKKVKEARLKNKKGQLKSEKEKLVKHIKKAEASQTWDNFIKDIIC